MIIWKLHFTLDLGTQQEGEVCGSCFNPDKNFDCGKCVEGLECVEDPRSSLLPDLPSKCKVTLGNIFNWGFRFLKFLIQNNIIS